ncbi:MAG: zinc-binding dehydrogenase [SAR202 cluster bacterium]|nr:zinc-binding dehydrogenase [SAR202 cluster bacterium]
MRAAVYQGNQKLEIKDVPVPPTGLGQILVKVSHSAICGTDVHGFMYDVVPKGQIMGHEYSGTVVEVGKGVTQWKKGDRVAGGGGTPPPGVPSFIITHPRFNFRKQGWNSQPPWAMAYAEYVQMEAWQALGIPNEVSDVAASMAEPLAAAVHAVRRSGLKIGDSVAVFGAGPLGLFSAQVAKAAGAAPVVAIEPAPARREAAGKVGADAVIDPSKQDVETELTKLTGGKGPQIVFECAGAKSTLHQAMESVRFGGRVVLVALSWEPQPVVPVDFITRDVELTTTFAHGTDDWLVGFDLIKKGKVNTDALLTKDGIIPLEKIQETFLRLTKPTDEIKVVVKL